MTKKELFTKINSLCREMDEEYLINDGGCCFVAAVIAENLERFNIKFRAIEYFCPCHYVIEVEDRLLNRGSFPPRNSSKVDFDYLDRSSSHELYDIYYSNDWNHMYSRRWNLIVSTRIKALFNKYGNSRKRLCSRTNIK